MAATAQEAVPARLEEPESTHDQGPGLAVVAEEIVTSRGTTLAALCPTGVAMWEIG